MESLIALSEIARNLSLPGIAAVAAGVGLWQARVSHRKNGYELIAKAGEMISSEDPKKRITGFALLLESLHNGQSREMATRLLWTYIWSENDRDLLRDCRRLGIDSSVADWIEWRMSVVDRNVGGRDNDK